MEIDTSNSIRVSLIRTANNLYIPTIEATGRVANVASAIPVGTPNVLLQESFGAEYDGFAIATIAGTAFEIKPVSRESQSLEQLKLVWEWNIAPKYEGTQVINVSIQVVWKPKNKNTEPIERQIWLSGLNIDVWRPWVSTGQLSIFSIVSGVMGAALTTAVVGKLQKSDGNKKGKSTSFDKRKRR